MTGEPYSCAGGSACQADGQVASPTPAMAPFTCAKGKVPCNGAAGSDHGAISATNTGYFCCYADPDACATSRGVLGAGCKCETSGPGSVCTLFPTPYPTPAIVPPETPSPTPVASSRSKTGADESHSGRLSAGDIVGVIIAALVVVGLAGLLVTHTMRERARNTQRVSFNQNTHKDTHFQQMTDE